MKAASYYRKAARDGQLYIERLDEDAFLVAEGFTILRFASGHEVFDSRSIFPSFPDKVGETVALRGVKTREEGVLGKNWAKEAPVSLFDSGYVAKIGEGPRLTYAAVYVPSRETREWFKVLVNMEFLKLLPSDLTLSYRGSSPSGLFHVDAVGIQIAVMMPMMAGNGRQDRVLREDPE